MRSGFFTWTILLTLMALLQGCSDPSPLGRLGGVIDSLMNSRPDSVLTILNTLLPDTNQMSKGTLMRFHLLRTNAENKCDTVLTARHATLMHRVCDYYDNTSSLNSRMLAHYLLGRCYDDMGEAPAALQEFHNAADAADTLKPDCNFHLLSRIYAQMADLYYMQNLPEFQQEALSNLLLCTKRTGENAVEVWAVHCKATILEQSGRKKEALSVLQDEYNAQKAKGEIELSAQLLGLINSIKIDLGLVDNLTASFREYEEHSGFFDDKGYIIPGKELYYAHKGKYYMAIGRPDSAEILFRKCLTMSASVENKYAGASYLLGLYERTNMRDSIVKYAKLCASLCDSQLRSMHTQTLLQQENLYNYTRNEQKANNALIKVMHLKQERLLWGIVVIICVLLMTTGLIQFHSYRKKKYMQMQMITNNYREALHKHEQASYELQSLKDMLNSMESKEEELKERQQTEISEKEKRIKVYRHNITFMQGLIADKEKRLGELREQILSLNVQLATSQQQVKVRVRKDLDEELESSAVIKRLRSYLEMNPYQKMIKTDHQELRSVFRDVLPSFYQTLIIENSLSLSKYDVCMLYRLNFRSSEIAKLLGVSNSAVTQARKKICLDIMKSPENGDEFFRFINQIM